VDRFCLLVRNKQIDGPNSSARRLNERRLGHYERQL